MKTLILGTAFNSSAAQVRPFVESLRRFHEGEVQLLVTSAGPADLLPYLQQWRITPRLFETAHWMAPHITVSRHVRCWEILRESAVQYDRILLTDVSDVSFQADPFIGAPEGELVFFMEDPGITIGACASNSDCTRHVFGPEGLARVAHCPISCNGTVMGSHAAMLDYLAKLLAHAPPALMATLSSWQSHDQAIHNFLLHTGAFPQVRTVPNGDWVLTMAQMPEGAIKLGPDGLRSPSGTLSPVLHQWNYHPRVETWVRRLLQIPPL